MTVSLIRLDSKIIGLASATPGDQGLGVLTWFHLNKAAYSMDHALKHEGYSVDEPAELDCHDVESVITAICERAGVTMESKFVPFSQSRNAKGDKPWRSLNWEITVKRYGRDVLTTDYSQGEGFAPASKKTIAQLETAARVMGRPVSVAKKIMIDHEIETGRIATGHSWSHSVRGGKPIDPPAIGEVLQSLARDSDVLDYGGFESWASEFGYEPDSRKAESIYRACVDIATKLRATLGEALLSEIRLAAQFN